MNVVRPFVLCGLLLAAPVAQAQTVHGVVKEDGTETTIAGVFIELVSADDQVAVSAYSDSVGAFLLAPGSAGRYTLRATHPSFVAVRSQRLSLRRDDLLGVELSLGRAAIALDPLRVATRSDARLAGFRERMKQPGFGYYLTREQLETRRGATRATDLLREIPGVEIIPVKRGGTKVSAPSPFQQETVLTLHLVAMRGRTGTCQPALFVDGLRVQQTTESGLDDFLQPDMLEGVEIYTGSAGLPSQFSAPDACGAVLFWSRGHGSGEAPWKTRLLAAAAGLLLVFGSALVW